MIVIPYTSHTKTVKMAALAAQERGHNMGNLVTRRGAILGGLGTIALMRTGVAQEKIVLKMGTLGSVEYFYYKGAKRMADEVAQKSGGRIDIQVFPNQQLGNERDMIEGMQLGTIDFAVINTPLLAGFDPRFLIFDMPFMFDDWTHVSKVLTSQIGADLMQSLEAKKIKAFAFSTAGFRHILNYKRPVRTPEDLAGLKIRTLDNPVHVAIMNAMGANATPMQYNQVATALHQHTIDGLDSPAPAAVTEKFYETNKYMALTGHVFTGVIYLMSLERFLSLPPDLQKVVADAAKIGAENETELYNKFDAESLDILAKQHGMQIDKVDRSLFRARMKPVFDSYQDRVGKALIEEVGKLRT
jgi:TRAP-type transport system periplasmic protein